jgi:glutamate-ammonia-ligase adenylyltransferase
LLGDVLEHVPEELQAIADQRIPETLKDRNRLVHEAAASLEWREPERRLDGLRRFKRRAMLQVALADIGGTVDVETVGAGLADLADACVEGALKDIDAPFAVIGMGKLGGRELNYSSDIDVMFVHDTSQGEAEEIAEGLLRSIGEVTPEGQAFRIDANLRPEGKSGPLTRSLESYLEYYARWAKPWEHQALLKARVAAGDPGVGNALIEGTRRFAYPEHLSADVVTQIRHLKARMERERIPRGTDPRRHLKLGPGGLSDVEFSAQILQLQHAQRLESLRVTGTLPALRIARDEDLLSEDDARRLGEAYIWLMRLRNRLFFLSGRPTDALPPTPEGLEALGIAMGYREQPRQELEEAYLRFTRRARRSAESLIYGGKR